MSAREPNLADLLGPTFLEAPTLPVVTNDHGELVLVLLTDQPLGFDIDTAVCLHHLLQRGVLVLV